MTLSRSIGLGLLLIGILLLVWGYDSSESISSKFSDYFTGSPSDETIWLLALGILSSVIGLVLSVRPGKRNIHSR